MTPFPSPTLYPSSSLLPFGLVSPSNVEWAISALRTHREESWRVDVLSEADESPLGTLDGVGGGTFDFSVFDTIRSSGTITYNGSKPVAWHQVRLQPWYTMTSATGEEISWPLGVFIPATPSTNYQESNYSISVDLYDKLLVLDQDKVETTYTVDAGDVVTDAIREVIESTGETRIAVTPSTETLNTPMVWEAGTSKLRIANDLLESINYFSLWCDGFGAYRADPYVVPTSRGVAWDFDDGARAVYSPDFVHSEDGFDVPNKVITTSRSDGETEALTATATNEDPASPWSYQSRGRWIAHVETDVEATSAAVLGEIAARRLLDLSQVGSTFEIKHLLIPLDLNAAVTFRRAPFGVDALAVVQKFTISMDVGALVTTTIREVSA